MSERTGGHTFPGRSFRPIAASLWALALPALVAAVLGAAAAVPAAAGSGQWTSIGPPRGIFYDLAGAWNSPGTVYAGSPLGDLWNSADGGVTWSFAGRLSANASVGYLSVNPGQATTVYWTSLVGVYRSSDSGVTWQLVLGGLPISSVAISPAAPQTAYVYLNTSIQRSDDTGLTWSRRPSSATTTVPPGRSCRCRRSPRCRSALPPILIARAGSPRWAVVT